MMNGYVLASAAVLFNVAANLALSSVLRDSGLTLSFASAWTLLTKLVTNPVAYVAGVAAILSMVTWAMTLSCLPLNKAIPVLSVMFVLIPIGSHFLYGESLSFRVLLAAVLIAVGVSLSATNG